jgi:hypothetical protein
MSVLAAEPLEDINFDDAEQRAHAVSGALSTLDLVEIDPAEFWDVFGTDSMKPTTMAWLENSLRKLHAIKAAA